MLTGHLQLYMLFPLCSCSMILCLKWRLRQAVLYTCSCSLICYFLLGQKPGLKLMIPVKIKQKNQQNFHETQSFFPHCQQRQLGQSSPSSSLCSDKAQGDLRLQQSFLIFFHRPSLLLNYCVKEKFLVHQDFFFFFFFYHGSHFQKQNRYICYSI